MGIERNPNNFLTAFSHVEFKIYIFVSSCYMWSVFWMFILYVVLGFV